MTSFFLMILRFVRAFKKAFKDPEFKVLTYVTCIILISGTTFYHLLEHWSILDSLYFSVTTLTTVGYGDLTPIHPISKIFTIFYIFIGIGVILGFVNAVARHASKEKSVVTNIAKETYHGTKNFLQKSNIISSEDLEEK